MRPDVAPPPPPPVPWTVHDVWLGVSSFALWILLFVLFKVVVTRFPVTLDPGLVVSLGELLLLIPVWFLALRKYRANWQDLGLRPFARAMVALGCGLMLASFLFNMVYGLFWGDSICRSRLTWYPFFKS